MYITNVNEVLPLLRGKLKEYLSIKLGVRSNARKIQCFVHNDENPSMYFNPKANDELVKCFSCGWNGDIFAAAEHIENLPSSGPTWITETIPHLCKLLEIPIKLGEPSTIEREKMTFYKLAQDITDILLENSPEDIEYLKTRNWEQDSIAIGTISEDILISKLVKLGWDSGDINRSMLIRTKNFSFFGEDKITFVIKDYRRRPIGFITKPLNDTDTRKYINSAESPIYEKITWKEVENNVLS